MESDDTLRARELTTLGFLVRYYQALMRDDTVAHRTEYERAAGNYVRAYLKRRPLNDGTEPTHPR